MYDSGVGGLSVLPALRRALPEESFVYVADSGHAPYGERSIDFLRQRADAVFGFLLEQGVRAVVIACNTASVALARELRERYPLPIVAMEPAIKPAVQLTRTGQVLVLATSGTVRSEAVARLCREHGTQVNVKLQACPGLAEQVERGELHTPATRALIERYVAPAREQGADTIVLGCTHYAFLADTLAEVAGPGVTLVEPSEAIARQLVRVRPVPAVPDASPGSVRYVTSGEPAVLQDFLRHIGETAALAERLPRVTFN